MNNDAIILKKHLFDCSRAFLAFSPAVRQLPCAPFSGRRGVAYGLLGVPTDREILAKLEYNLYSFLPLPESNFAKIRNSKCYDVTCYVVFF